MRCAPIKSELNIVYVMAQSRSGYRMQSGLNSYHSSSLCVCMCACALVHTCVFVCGCVKMETKQSIIQIQMVAIVHNNDITSMGSS